MYKVYNIAVDTRLKDFLDKHIKDFKCGTTNTINYKEILKASSNETGIYSADEIRNKIFPSIDADIFISHSHRDREIALKLANYLKNTFDLNAFIDSSIWGNVYQLADTLQKSKPDTKNNDIVTKMDMILISALTSMLDHCECVFFINTKNSIAKDFTSSPWIYYELFISNLLPIEIPERLASPEIRFRTPENKYLTVSYHIDIHNLPKINFEEFSEWSEIKNKKGKPALNCLYELIDSAAI